MSLGLTVLNRSATNQYQAQMVGSMRVGQGYNLLKGTSQDVLEIPPYISQAALLGETFCKTWGVWGSAGAWGREACGAEETAGCVGKPVTTLSGLL